MKTLIATIPFSGFYHSLHDQIIDDQIALMFSDDQGEDHTPEEFWNHYHGRDICKAYSVAYVEKWKEVIKEEFDLDLPGVKFHSLESPREYNFSTDRIFIELTEQDYKNLLLACDLVTLARRIRERFTSRDGFMSFYSNKLKDWLKKPISEWDVNEVGTVIEAVTDSLEIDPYESELHEEVYDVVSDNLPEECGAMLDKFNQEYYG